MGKFTVREELVEVIRDPFGLQMVFLPSSPSSSLTCSTLFLQFSTQQNVVRVISFFSKRRLANIQQYTKNGTTIISKCKLFLHSFCMNQQVSMCTRLSFRLLFSFSIQHPLCWANLRMKKKNCETFSKKWCDYLPTSFLMLKVL